MLLFVVQEMKKQMADKKYNHRLILNVSLLAVLFLIIVLHFPALLHSFRIQKGCSVSFVDVGQGDSCVIQIEDGTTIIIDGGENFYPGTKKKNYDKKLKRWLEKKGITRFDIVMATHPHSDHIGGLTRVLKEYPVGIVIDHGYSHTSFLYERFWKIIKAGKIAVLQPSAGEEIILSEDAKLIFLSPPEDKDFGSLNENSLVVKFVYRNVSFLFMADAGVPAEKRLLQDMAQYLQSDVLKVGHHGSRTSSSEEFIAKVSPSISIISCGRNNIHGLPDEDVLQTLEKSGSKIFRTDENGTITISTDGENLIIKEEK